MGFKWKDDLTPLVLDFIKYCECLYNTKSEHYWNRTFCETAL